MKIHHLVLPLMLCVASGLGAQDQKAAAQALVKEAIAFAQKNGREALLKETNFGTGRFHVKRGNDLYIFIYDLKGTCLAIGFQGQMVGVNRWGAKDPDGKPFVQEIIQTGQAKGGGWVDYKYPDPKTGQVEAKTSFVESVDGMVVGCGIYK